LGSPWPCTREIQQGSVSRKADRPIPALTGEEGRWTEAYIKQPGVTVGLAESLRVCREILDAVHDGIPTQAFYFTGGLDAVLARAAAR
jgi:F0F1-type ATP synthase beta subunit